MIHIIRDRATVEPLADMMQQLDNYVKLAVDLRRGVLAGGGTLHADCEMVLLDDGSKQDDIWGADWYPSTQELTFESLINLRPGRGNFALEIQSDGCTRRLPVVNRPQVLGLGAVD